MPFRGDDSRRYGHVPSAQYPIPTQSQNPIRPPPSSRVGFSEQAYSSTHSPVRRQVERDEELFMPSPTEQVPLRGTCASHTAVDSWQPSPSAQAPSTPTHWPYNPQHFAWSPSQLQSPPPWSPPPWSPQSPPPSSSQSPPQSPSQSPSQSPPRYPHTTTRHTQAASPSGYAQAANSHTPQAYNPAAYANTNAGIPQRQSTVAGYSNGRSGHSGQVGQTILGPIKPHHPVPSSPTIPSRHEPITVSSPGQAYASWPWNEVTPPSSTYPAASCTAPYPAYFAIPVGPMYSSAEPTSFASQAMRGDGQTPVGASTGQDHGRTGISRHPTNAPLPRRPVDNGEQARSRIARQEHATAESLLQDLFYDLGAAPARRRKADGDCSDDERDEDLLRYDSNASTINPIGDSGVNRFASNASTINRNHVSSTYAWDSEESDVESTGGLMAMQRDMDGTRLSNGVPLETSIEPCTQPVTDPRPMAAEEQESTDSDFGGMDLGMYGGGYAGTLQYGNDVGSPQAATRSFEGGQGLVQPGVISPFSAASVDYGGTGGLHAPLLHRPSFEEGEEHESTPSHPGQVASAPRNDYPDMFYHPGLSNRPLPALPPPSPRPSSVAMTDCHQQAGLVERSASLSSHSNTPMVQAPARSRTDAAEERKKALKQAQLQPHGGTRNSSYDDTGTPASVADYDMITLPSGRRKKFVPSKLSSVEFGRCTEPWALSAITSWVRDMAEGEADLKRKTIEEGLVKLFCFQVPTMHEADAEALSTAVAESMFAAGMLTTEEEWVRFEAGAISGVLWQLTGSGCYGPKLHEHEGCAAKLQENGLPVRCYSYHCGRTLKKANLDHMLSEEVVVTMDWAKFYNLSAQEMGKRPKKEIERQNVLHEIISGEEEFMSQLDVLRVLYRDQIRKYRPPIIAASRLDKFLDAVFGKVEAVQQINKEHLLAQLKYRQQEQGPFILGVSDLFREWIRKARPIYVTYCSAYPHAAYLIRREAGKNVLFHQFLDMVRESPRSKRLEWTHFIKTPITRLQRYGLLLETVRRTMLEESEEKTNLAKALEEIRAVTHECDEKVAEMTKKVDLLELQSSLVLRPGFQSVLNLDHLGRELLKQGELQRQGCKGVRWLDTHALLFDHYFILAKPVVAKDGQRRKKYDVSKEPIPMPLLFLESNNDDAVMKQKGLSAPLGRATTAAGSSTQLAKVMVIGSDRPGLEQHGTGSSGAINTVTRLAPSNDDKIIYPFRLKHLGHELYTLYASSSLDRTAWCNAMVEAKTRHARALHAQNAEPFRLRVLADYAFAHEINSVAARQTGVPIPDTPLDRAVREMETVYGRGRAPTACRAPINCATAFRAYGKDVLAVGTEIGIYITAASDPRGWMRTIQAGGVTQMAVLEEFSICLVLANKSLISYPLHLLVPLSSSCTSWQDDRRRAPQRLAKDVSFFATARMKDRMLLFYKRREGIHNTFKVLEPVLQRATEKQRRLFGGRRPGHTDAFRDFDDFYLPTECYSLNLFHTYIAVASARGFELLTLDKKVTQSIPQNVQLPNTTNILQRIKDQRPLGMFKINDQEFLLTYEDCAVYIDKHGEISRTLIMEYSGRQKTRGATMFGQYLVLFNEDYVEIRNAENGRLRQIIAGRDVRVLDHGFRGPTGDGTMPPASGSRGTIKICMNHPDVAGGIVVLEMLLNDGHMERHVERVA